MTHVSELLFVDPSVDDLETIIGGLRSGVKAIILDRFTPVARQIAVALRSVHNLEAVHLIAHGAPGRVNFSAGEWSLATLADDAGDLAAIERALAEDGELRLWSCATGAGEAGSQFVDALSCGAGVNVAAAKGLVGAAAKGGRWELPHSAIRPPLTETGVASYAGVFPATLISTGKGEQHAIFGKWPASTPAGTYFIVLNNNGTLEVVGKFIVPANVDSAGTFAISTSLPAGRYIVGSNNAGPGTITVYNGKWRSGARREGTWSPGNFDPAITPTLNHSRNAASNLSGAVGC